MGIYRLFKGSQAWNVSKFSMLVTRDVIEHKIQSGIDAYFVVRLTSTVSQGHVLGK